MSYFGHLNREQIAEAEEIKKNLISEINNEFAIIKKDYDESRKHGVSLKEREYKRELKILDEQLRRIMHMNLPVLLRKYPKFASNLQNEIKGGFVFERSQGAKIAFFLIMISAVFLLRFFNEKVMVAFVLIAGALAIFYAASHKHPPKLVAVKA